MRSYDNSVSYTEEGEIERAVDSHLRSMEQDGSELTPNLLSNLDDSEGLRETTLEHLSYELETVGEVGDYRVEEVIDGYASAESKWDTPDLDEGIE